MSEALNGEDFYAYRKTGGSFGTPTLSLMAKVRDVNFKIDGDKQEIHNRGSKWKKARRGKSSMDVTLVFEYRADDADIQALQDAVDNDTVVTLAIANGPVADAGTVYWKADFKVFTDDEPQNDGGVVIITFECGLADTANEPTKVTVS